MKAHAIVRTLLVASLLGSTASLFAQQGIAPTLQTPPQSQPSLPPAQRYEPATPPAPPATDAVAPQQPASQLPSGATDSQLQVFGQKLVYTHYVGAFVLDTTALNTTTHAIFRSRPMTINGQVTGPLQAYDHQITYVGSGIFPYTGEFGHFCNVSWTNMPGPQMPNQLFFSNGDHFGQYNVYSRRGYGYWRHIGCFVRAPLGNP